MIHVEENRRINQALSTLYEAYCQEYLAAYRRIFARQNTDPPCRINEFGIIDEERYDTDAGVLFVARETNGWSNQEFKNGSLVCTWLKGISKEGTAGKGHVQTHPRMWYNIGRWAMYLNGTNRTIDELAALKGPVLPALGTIAFTNLNKVRGMDHAGKEYRALAGTEISGRLLRAELELLRPKTVVCCGTVGYFRAHAPEFSGTVISMPHPAARIRSAQMLRQLAMQLPG